MYMNLSTHFSRTLFYTFVQDSTDFQTVIDNKGQNEPYIIVCGGMAQPEQLMLIVDRHIIGDIHEDDAPFAVMSTYFVFNICYIPGCHNVFKFLESSLLDIMTKKIPPSINHFMAALSSFE